MMLTSKSATNGMLATVPPICASTIMSASPAAKNTKREIAAVLSEVREQSELGALVGNDQDGVAISCGYVMHPLHNLYRNSVAPTPCPIR